MTIWVLVADNSRARIFSAEKPASDLQEIRDLTHPEARLHEGDLVTDRVEGTKVHPEVMGSATNRPIGPTGRINSPPRSVPSWTHPARPEF